MTATWLESGGKDPFIRWDESARSLTMGAGTQAYKPVCLLVCESICRHFVIELVKQSLCQNCPLESFKSMV